MEAHWNWLTEKINSREFVILGYTSYSRKRVTSVNNGIYIGYKNGKPFFHMKFREGVTKVKLMQDIWSHHKSLIGVFDKIHSQITSPPLILLSSKKAVDWLKTSAYKWISISDKDKSKLFFWVDVLKPEFESYDITTQPFSLLRELALKEGARISNKVVKKEFYNYGQWLEI